MVTLLMNSYQKQAALQHAQMHAAATDGKSKHSAATAPAAPPMSFRDIAAVKNNLVEIQVAFARLAQQTASSSGEALSGLGTN